MKIILKNSQLVFSAKKVQELVHTFSNGPWSINTGSGVYNQHKIELNDIQSGDKVEVSIDNLTSLPDTKNVYFTLNFSDGSQVKDRTCLKPNMPWIVPQEYVSTNMVSITPMLRGVDVTSEGTYNQSVKVYR